MGTTLKAFQSFLREKPINVIIWKMYCTLFNSKIPNLKSWVSLIKDKSGLEIGGPSGIFSANNYLSIYPYVRSLDEVNFSNKTIWEGQLEKGNHYSYDHKTGFQFIAGGTNLNGIKNDTYDFVLSCNNLEHIANPIKGIIRMEKNN